MDSHDSFPFLKEIILFLALSGVLMPLLSRLRINAVLGFLSVGVLLGPYGLASLAPAWPPLSWFTFARPDQVEFLAELGVIFLMFMIVDSRCAITSAVRPSAASSICAWMAFSVRESSAEVASSKIRMAGFFNSARAMATRCFSPPESLSPRSPTRVS